VCECDTEWEKEVVVRVASVRAQANSPRIPLRDSSLTRSTRYFIYCNPPSIALSASFSADSSSKRGSSKVLKVMSPRSDGMTILCHPRKVQSTVRFETIPALSGVLSVHREDDLNQRMTLNHPPSAVRLRFSSDSNVSTSVRSERKLSIPA
jgi:hypothetical protein